MGWVVCKQASRQVQYMRCVCWLLGAVLLMMVVVVVVVVVVKYARVLLCNCVWVGSEVRSFITPCILGGSGGGKTSSVHVKKVLNINIYTYIKKYKYCDSYLVDVYILVQKAME